MFCSGKLLRCKMLDSMISFKRSKLSSRAFAFHKPQATIKRSFNFYFSISQYWQIEFRTETCSLVCILFIHWLACTLCVRTILRILFLSLIYECNPSLIIAIPTYGIPLKLNESYVKIYFRKIMALKPKKRDKCEY